MNSKQIFHLVRWYCCCYDFHLRCVLNFHCTTGWACGVLRRKGRKRNLINHNWLRYWWRDMYSPDSRLYKCKLMERRNLKEKVLCNTKFFTISCRFSLVMSNKSMIRRRDISSRLNFDLTFELSPSITRVWKICLHFLSNFVEML